MKKELLFVFVFFLIVSVAIGTQQLQNINTNHSSPIEKASAIAIPQLSEEGREKSATMVLIGAPPMQPGDHIDRWNSELHHESCMSCHGNASTGAPIPPENHYYENNRNEAVFRDNCIQCHATQNDNKPAFNSEE
jgi:nitrate reductase cytochrome c-type subunit